MILCAFDEVEPGKWKCSRPECGLEIPNPTRPVAGCRVNTPRNKLEKLMMSNAQLAERLVKQRQRKPCNCGHQAETI
jgi:hypothetical protein